MKSKTQINSLWPIIIDEGPHWLRQWLVAWGHHDLASVGFCDIHLRPISQWNPSVLFYIMSLKIIYIYTCKITTATSPRVQWVRKNVYSNSMWQNKIWKQINGLMKERRNSSANALELSLSCTNPLKYPLNSITNLLVWWRAKPVLSCHGGQVVARGFIMMP